jgi:hypothetical protein
MKGLAVLVFMLICCRAQAQHWPFDLWHDGKIILLTGDTLKGPIKYDQQQDIVQFTFSNQRIEAFSARKVLFFEIFDLTVKRYRQFFALPYTARSTYRAPVFFELLEEGKITLLSREALEYRTENSYYNTRTVLIIVYKYFFLEENGDINEFIGGKNDLLDRMGNKAEAVEKYMKSNRLDMDDKYEFAKIIAYYNSLFGT